MDRRQFIDLDNLAQHHCAEIDQMLSGIIGKSDATLWTASMRPATRGGKCMMIGASIEDLAE